MVFQTVSRMPSRDVPKRKYDALKNFIVFVFIVFKLQPSSTIHRFRKVREFGLEKLAEAHLHWRQTAHIVTSVPQPSRRQQKSRHNLQPEVTQNQKVFILSSLHPFIPSACSTSLRHSMWKDHVKHYRSSFYKPVLTSTPRQWSRSSEGNLLKTYERLIWKHMKTLRIKNTIIISRLTILSSDL